MTCSPERHHRKRGFALASTVLLIAISGLMLTGFARLSVNKSLEVLRDIQKLQTHWSAASVERLVFAEIGELLTEKRPGIESGEMVSVSIASLSDQLVLGDVAFEVLVADESSKLDLNYVDFMRGNDGVRDAIGNLAPSGSTQVELFQKRRRRDSKDNSFVSWDQVFVNEDGSSIEPEELIRMTRQLTCWGKRVGLNSASDDVLGEACRVSAGSSARRAVLNMRRQNTLWNVDEFLTALALPARQSGKLRQILSEGSVSQSIWIKATHLPSRSESYWLVIREGFIVESSRSANTFRYQAFHW